MVCHFSREKFCWTRCCCPNIQEIFCQCFTVQERLSTNLFALDCFIVWGERDEKWSVFIMVVENEDLFIFAIAWVPMFLFKRIFSMLWHKNCTKVIIYIYIYIYISVNSTNKIKNQNFGKVPPTFETTNSTENLGWVHCEKKKRNEKRVNNGFVYGWWVH